MTMEVTSLNPAPRKIRAMFPKEQKQSSRAFLFTGADSSTMNALRINTNSKLSRFITLWVQCVFLPLF